MAPNHGPSVNVKWQHGVSLIESLVAMVVLSFGVLGLLGFQLRTMVNNQNANHMATASRLADSLFERVKTNPNATPVLNPTFNPAAPLNAAQWGWLANYAVNWGATTVVATDCDAGFCTAAQRATWDINRWKQTVTQTLPNGEGRVLVSPDNPRQLVVIIGWRANEQGASPLVINIPGVAAPTECGTTHACYSAYGQP
jgi:type IV pilus assembly protein PilV